MTVPSLDYGFLAFFLYVIIALRYKKFNKSIFFTPLIIPFLTFTISFITIIYLHSNGYIPSETMLLLILQFAMYFVTFLLIPSFVKKKYLDMKRYFNLRKFDLQAANLLFYCSVIFSIIYISLFWTLYSQGSDRLFFNRDFRALSLLCTLFSLWSISVSSVIYSVTKKNKFIIFNVIIILLLSIMGSKGVGIVGLFVFLFFYFQSNSIKKRYITIAFLISGGLVIVPTQIMYGNSIDVIIHRVMMSGDIYLFSFVLGDYKDLIGFYDPISYFLHPYTSLIGIRGYDYPLGAQIIGTAGIPVTGVGPQDHMTILALTFFNNSPLYIFIFTFFICALISLFMIFTFYFFSLTRIHITIRSVVFMLIYTQIINIFVGINAFSFNIILCVLVVFLYVFVLFCRAIIDIFILERRKKYNKNIY